LQSHLYLAYLSLIVISLQCSCVKKLWRGEKTIKTVFRLSKCNNTSGPTRKNLRKESGRNFEKSSLHAPCSTFLSGAGVSIGN
jgi:hypothetical protein